MIYQSEAKFQGWRALAVYEDGGEGLLCVGRSTTQVKACYGSSFAELLDQEERARVKRISLQCWQGAADQGKWIHKYDLTVPGRQPIPGSAVHDPEPVLLAFREA